MRPAIVNFVTDVYKPGQERLAESLRDCCDYDLFMFDTQSLDCQPHSENPYAFKIYSIAKVRGMGYDKILWLDASVYAVKDPKPVFDWLSKKGIFLEEAGHWAGTWSPDYVLEYFGVTKVEAMQMPMFAGGYVGFDFTNKISVDFFKQWARAMYDGMFKGTWDVSRHDMAAGSIIANKMGLLPLYSPGGQFFAYIGDSFGDPKDSVVFHLRGIV